MGVTVFEQAIKRAWHTWMQKAVWVEQRHHRELDPDGPGPYCVCYGEDCACQEVAVATLRSARASGCDFVFTSFSLVGVPGAIKAQFGVMVMPSARALRLNGLIVWNDAPLPPVPELHCGIFVREGGNRAAMRNSPTTLWQTWFPEPFADRIDEETAAISRSASGAARRFAV